MSLCFEALCNHYACDHVDRSTGEGYPADSTIFCTRAEQIRFCVCSNDACSEIYGLEVIHTFGPCRLTPRYLYGGQAQCSRSHELYLLQHLWPYTIARPVLKACSRYYLLELQGITADGTVYVCADCMRRSPSALDHHL